MSGKLVATIEHRRSGARLIKFAGVLDEHNRLVDLTEKVGAGVALLNLAGVERINSTGARDWVTWLTSLSRKGTRPMLLACSPAVVAHLNRVKNFAGAATVKSFQVPYHCDGCGLDKLLLVHVVEMGPAPHEPPPCSCDACGTPMAFAEQPDTYFAFLTEQQAVQAEESKKKTLARGSTSPLTKEHISRISSPSLVSRGSRPSQSAFQDPKRTSDPELRAQMMPTMRSAHLVVLIGIIAALLIASAVFVYKVIT